MVAKKQSTPQSKSGSSSRQPTFAQPPSDSEDDGVDLMSEDIRRHLKPAAAKTDNRRWQTSTR
jgi:hypothetical protein